MILLLKRENVIFTFEVRKIIRELFNSQEKIIYTLLDHQSKHTQISLLQLSEYLQMTPRMIQWHLNLWYEETSSQTFKQQNQWIELPHSAEETLEVYLQLLQQNQALKLLWDLIEHPYTPRYVLEKKYYYSSSTFNRQLKKLKRFLAPYQIQISFTCQPVIKGCEFQIRWLGWFLSLVFDPPFNWRSTEELFQRFEEIQHLRIQTGHCLNQLSTTRINSLDYSYQISERAWRHLGKELLTFKVPLNTLETSTLFLCFQKKKFLDFYDAKQKKQTTSFLVAESLSDKDGEKYHH